MSGPGRGCLKGEDDVDMKVVGRNGLMQQLFAARASIAEDLENLTYNSEVGKVPLPHVGLTLQLHH